MSVKTNKNGHIEIHIDNAFLETDEQAKVLSDFEKRNEVENYVKTLHSITYYLNHIGKDFEDNEYKYHMICLLENMLPDEAQAMRMFNTPIRK